jgi:UDP-glucose 4-epimerase
MTPRRVLLTGASGFVGSCLARRLLTDGHDVQLLLRAESERWRLVGPLAALQVHEADLRDEHAVKRAVDAVRPDWIFHMAAHGAYSWQSDGQGIFQSNALGTLNLTCACVERGFEAFVHAGSSSEYGFKDHAPGEEELLAPESLYAVAKAAATLLCRQLAMRHGLRLATLRLYSVYGPWEDPRRLVPTLLAHALRGALPPLVDAATARDFVHVDDVCDALLLVAAASGSGEAVYNLGTGVQTSVGELVELVRGLCDVTALPEWGSYGARSWDTSVWVADASKIRRELGWAPRRTLSDGLAGTASWLRESTELHERYGVSGG